MNESGRGGITTEFNDAAKAEGTISDAKVELTQEFNDAASNGNWEGTQQSGSSAIDLTKEFNEAAKPPDDGGDDFSTPALELNPPTTPTPKF
jgi:hypothetical protein